MKKLLVLPLVTLLLASCASMKTTSEKTEEVDFTQYKTYKILPYVNEEDALNKKITINDINKARIERALMESLTLRGLDTATQADMIILYALNVDVKKTYSANTTYMGGGPYYGGYSHGYGSYYGYRGGYYGGYGYGGGAYTTYEENSEEIGLLRVGVVDPTTGKLIWLGATSERIKNKPNKAEKRINRVIRKIMMDFPITNH